MIKIIQVVAAVIEKDGKIFCAQRGYGSLANKWEFPGGKIEKDETHQQTLIREIKEELNSVVKVNDFLMRIEHDYETFKLIMNVYHCDLLEGDLQISEHIDSKWLTREELKSLDWAEADIQVVDKLVLQQTLLDDKK